MKKILSLLLTLCLLLTPVCAFAENSLVQAQISQIDIYLGDTETPIPIGLSLLLSLVSGEKGDMAALDVYDGEDSLLASFGAALNDKGIDAAAMGMSHAYHLSPEAIEALVASLEEEAGMSLEDMLTKLTDSFSASSDMMANIDIEKFSTEWSALMEGVEVTESGTETVLVYDEEYELSRTDIHITEEQGRKAAELVFGLFNQVIDQFSASLAELVPEEELPELTLGEGSTFSADAAIWNDEVGEVVRAEIAYNLTVDGETVTVPLVIEYLCDEDANVMTTVSSELDVDGQLVEVSFELTSTQTEDETRDDLSIYVSVTDEDDTMQAVQLYLLNSSDAEGNYLMAQLMAFDGADIYDMGAYYSYNNTVEDESMEHNAYVDFWYYVNEGEEDQQVYEIDFMLDLYFGSTESDPVLDVDGVSTLEIDQMTEDDMAQTQNELMSVVSGLVATLMADEGVQQLINFLTAA